MLYYYLVGDIALVETKSDRGLFFFLNELTILKSKIIKTVKTTFSVKKKNGVLNSCQNCPIITRVSKNLNFAVLFKFICFSILAKVLFAAETFLGPKGKHIPPLTIVQFLTIALSPSPSDSLNALNTHWGKLSKLSMQCSLVNWWPIQIRLNSKQSGRPL